MEDIDAMVATLAAALAETMTHHGPVPGSVLDTMMSPANSSAARAAGSPQRLGVLIVVADMVVGRLTDFVEFVSDVIDVDQLE